MTTYHVIGLSVYTLDTDNPDAEPTLHSGQGELDALFAADPMPRKRLLRCCSCDKFFVDYPGAGLCEQCDFEADMAHLADAEHTEHTRLLAHELMVCADDCNHCNYEESL